MGGIIARRRNVDDVENNSKFKRVLSRYGERCDWLNDDRFLRDLERDSVDTDLLDDELRSLKAHESVSWRERLHKCLDSNPLQIAMCILVLIDAGVVVGEILLDFHAIKIQSREATLDLHLAMDYLKNTFQSELDGYNGDNILYILDKLPSTDHDSNNYEDNRNEPKNNDSVGNSHGTSASGALGIKRRSVSDNILAEISGNFVQPTDTLVFSRTSDDVLTTQTKRDDLMREDSLKSIAELSDRKMTSTSLSLETKHDVEWEEDREMKPRVVSYETSSFGETAAVETSTTAEAIRGAERCDGIIKSDSFPLEGSIFRVRRHGASDDVDVSGSHGSRIYYYKQYSEAYVLFKIAHTLHFISIAILGVFVLLVHIKVVAMGCHFFKKKMEVFDAVVIVASFVMDLVFVDGITGAQSEETIIVIMVFLLWRILRIVNGILVSTKNQHEFRIKLQKRARRRLDRKIDNLNEQLDRTERETIALRGLCLTKGATEDEVSLCKPKPKSNAQLLTTTCGLSSIASLSLGLSLSGNLIRSPVVNPLNAAALMRSGRSSFATGTKSTRSSVSSLSQSHIDPNLLTCVMEHRPNGLGSSRSIDIDVHQAEDSLPRTAIKSSATNRPTCELKLAVSSSVVYDVED